MMSCDRMENDGMRYIDGEMTPAQAAEFERHLEGCETCMRSIAELGRVDSMAGRMRIADPMDVFWEGYWKSIYKRGERRTAWILIVAGAAATVLFGIFEIGRNFGPGDLRQGGRHGSGGRHGAAARFSGQGTGSSEENGQVQGYHTLATEYLLPRGVIPCLSSRQTAYPGKKSSACWAL